MFHNMLGISNGVPQHPATPHLDRTREARDWISVLASRMHVANLTPAALKLLPR
jgi:hypothetical protein